MIVGKLKHIDRYKGLTPNIDKAIELIKTTDFLTYSVGKHDLDGDKIRLLREDYEPRDREECYFEGHKNYIDIQIVVTGCEVLAYANVENLEVTEAYNDTKDVAKFKGNSAVEYTMDDGTFALVFPEDIHMVKIKPAHGNKPVKKAVLKVKL